MFDLNIKLLDSLFPFHVLYSKEGKIVHAGKSLLKLFPEFKILENVKNCTENIILRLTLNANIHHLYA